MKEVINNEKNSLRIINNKFVPKLIDFLQSNNFFHLVLEYCPGLTLQKLLQNIKYKSFIDQYKH